jgi:hypothetical protein
MQLPDRSQQMINQWHSFNNHRSRSPNLHLYPGDSGATNPGISHSCSIVICRFGASFTVKEIYISIK